VSGLYIHVPFCRKACYYCDFHFSTNLRNIDQIVAAICQEILGIKKTKTTRIETIYFGGGTPSVLNLKQLKTILDSVHNCFQIDTHAEVTIEVNPDDLSLDYLYQLKEVGFNRLSIGVQSFYEQHLKWMNRSHSSKQAIYALKWAVETGFKTSSVDLIYGFEGLEMQQWKDNVNRVLDSGLHHISCYALTIEENTPFAKIELKTNTKLVQDENAWHHFKYVHEAAIKMGWDHYELSNFSKQGYTSRHNQAYWKGKPYFGVGPGAHSFNGTNQRSWNISDNWKYIDLILANSSDYKSTETLNEKDQGNEKIMVGLRTEKGIRQELVQTQLNDSSHPIHSFLREGMAKIDRGYLSLSLQGWWQSDHIISTLFRV